MQFTTPPLVTKKGMSDNIESPQKTFFFERKDGTIFFTNEREAWNIYSGKLQIIGTRVERPKLIGTSDGKITNQAIIEARAIFEKEGMAKAQEYIRMAQDMELASAKEHIIPPRDFSFVDDRGNPTSMSELNK